MSQAADADPALGTHPYRWTMLAGVWLAYYSFGLTAVSMAPVVGVISSDLGLNHSTMGAILGAWQLVYIGTAIPCGALLDQIGLRRSLFLGVILVGLSGTLRAFATDEITLFLAVGLFGFGGPLISIGAPKAVSQWFEGSERGLAMGIYMTAVAFGGISSLSLTNSVLMPAFDGAWRSVLLTYAGFVLVCALVWLLVASHPAARVAEAQAARVPRPPRLQVFVELVRMPAVRIIMVISIGIFFFGHALNNWLPEILRTGGMSPAQAGFWAAVPVSVGLVGALAIPRLAVGRRRFMVLLALFLCAGTASLLLHSPPGPGLAMGLALQGLAQSSMMTVTILVLLDLPGLTASSRGLAGGLFFATAEIGGVLGPLTVGVLSDLTGGFTAPLYLLTAVCAVLMALGLLLRRTIR